MSYFGLHLQTPVTGWKEAVARAAAAGKPYRIVKSFWVEAGKTVKALSPSTVTVFRHNVEHKDPFLDKAIISPAHADEAADEFIFQFRDSVNQHGFVNYTESLNETYASRNLLNQQKAVAFDRAFIRRLKIHCPNTRPVVYTAASGNIDHDEYRVLLDLARECMYAGGAFGYHNYWSVVNSNTYVQSPNHAYDYHMRWSDSLDEYLVGAGIRVKHMLGESGPIGAGQDGYWQKPDDGWLKNDVWNGSEDGYLRDLAAMDSLYRNSRAAQENRLLGATLFTTGEPHVGWDYFQIRGSMLDRLTDYVMGSEVPPPIPPPDEPANFEQVVWALTSEMQKKGQNGIRLNADAGIQQQVSENNRWFGTDYQVVTAEAVHDGRAVQAVESLSGNHPRLVYVWEEGKPIYFFEDPNQ